MKSLKGEPFNGYSDFKFSGKVYQINAQDSSAAYYLWSNWARRILNDLNLGKIALVPVPSSSQIKFGQDTCPARMANSVAALIPRDAVVGNFLRHTATQPKAHSQGGSRDPDQIAATLDCRVMDASLPVVLIDDVMSTGGHLKACARVLRQHGLTVEHVLLAGRTVWSVVPNPYVVAPEDIEDVPDFDDWLSE